MGVKSQLLELAERLLVREESSKGSLRDVLETFEAVAQNLDNAADGNDPEIAARIEKAKAIALRGSEIVREHVDQLSSESIQMAG